MTSSQEASRVGKNACDISTAKDRPAPIKREGKRKVPCGRLWRDMRQVSPKPSGRNRRTFSRRSEMSGTRSASQKGNDAERRNAVSWRRNSNGKVVATTIKTKLAASVRFPQRATNSG